MGGGWVNITPVSQLRPGLYRVEVPLFWTEISAMAQFARSDRSWNTTIEMIERTRATGMLRLGWPPVGGGFKYRFPRTNLLNPTTGRDSPSGAYLLRKGYDSARGSFWCLIGVSEVLSSSKVADLYEKIVAHLPGLLPMVAGTSAARLRSLGHPVTFQLFMAGSTPAPTPTYQTPSTPAPSTGVKPIPAPAPSPAPTPAPKPTGTTSAPKTAPAKTAPAKTVTQAAKTATTKVVQATKTATAKTVQTTKAATTKAVKTASTNPVAVVAACVAGVLLLKYLQAGRGT